MHITDYFNFIFSMLPPDFSNQPTKSWNADILKEKKLRGKVVKLRCEVRLKYSSGLECSEKCSSGSDADMSTRI